MKNEWFVTEQIQLVDWVADLTQLLSTPDLLVEWSCAASAIASSCLMAIPEAVPEYNLSINHLHSIPKEIQFRYQTKQEIDLLSYADQSLNSGAKVATQIAFLDNGVVSEQKVSNVGELPLGVRNDLSNKYGNIVNNSSRFFSIGGHLIRSLDHLTLIKEYYNNNSYNEDCFSVVFSLHSDIWLPWIDNQKIDNRMLARIHTSRLNAFLDQMRQLTLRLGGEWAFEACAFTEFIHETGVYIAS
ncbi:MAG: hypothetical protein R3B84_09265 [Zavarzinella sp.]